MTGETKTNEIDTIKEENDAIKAIVRESALKVPKNKSGDVSRGSAQ